MLKLGPETERIVCESVKPRRQMKVVSRPLMPSSGPFRRGKAAERASRPVPFPRGTALRAGVRWSCSCLGPGGGARAGETPSGESVEKGVFVAVPSQ